MIGYILVFLIVMKIMRSTGRISPVWGMVSVVCAMLLDLLFNNTLVYYNDFHFYDDKIFDKTERLMAIYSLILSVVFTLIIFYIISKFLKKKNWRNEVKKSIINYQIVGFIITLLSIYSMFYAIDIAGLGGITYYMILWRIIFTIIVVTYCFRYYIQIKQAKDNKKNLNPSILFLRSFDNAKKTSRGYSKEILLNTVYRNYFDHWIFGYTFDQVLTPYLNKNIGEVVALGNPNDYLPELGAPKIYMPDNTDFNSEPWWETATKLMNKVKLNIVFESSGNNIKRELEYIRIHINPYKLIIITYPKDYKVNDWNEFYNVCKNINIEIPKSFPGGGVVLTFNSMWQYKVSSVFNNDINSMVKYIKEKKVLP